MCFFGAFCHDVVAKSVKKWSMESIRTEFVGRNPIPDGLQNSSSQKSSQICGARPVGCVI